jgi:hypothetical protein
MAAEDYVDFNDGYWDERDDAPRQRFTKVSPIPGALRNGALWSAKESEQVRSMHRNLYSTAAIAKELGRTELSIQYRLKLLGLEENPIKNELTVNFPKGALVVPSDKPKKVNLMHANMQHLIALLQKGYTTITVAFFRENSGNSFDSKVYTYKVPQAMADILKPGDLVVVPAREAFSVAQVSEIHAEPQIDVSKPLALRWVVQKIDRAAYDDQTAREAEAIKSVEVAQRRQAQEEALATLLGTTEDREAFLKLISPVQA